MAIAVSSSKNWTDYEATSTSSVAVATGTLNFTIETGKAWSAGDDIACVPTAAKIPMMLIGTVTSYNSGTGALVVSIGRMESTICSWDLVSSTSNTIGTGSKTFVTYNGKSSLLAGGDAIRVVRQSGNAGTGFVGTVTSYNNADGTLVMNAASTGGSGTLTNWIIVSDGTFSAWDFTPAPTSNIDVQGTAVFTINTQPKYPIPSLTGVAQGKINISNSSTTTPIVLMFANRTKTFQAEVNTESNITGDWITIYTGNGTASQTISLSGSPYTLIDFPSIEVETGSGTGVYRYWYNFSDSASPYGYSSPNYVARHYRFAMSAFGKSKHGNVYLWDASTRTIKFGDGTNGNVIPNGAKVRIPNIHITCDIPRTPLLTAISSGTAATFAVNLGKGSNLSVTANQPFIINNEGFTGSITTNSLSISARATDSTTAANHAQGDSVFLAMAATSVSGNSRVFLDSFEGGKLNWSKVSFGHFYAISQGAQSLSLSDVFTIGGCSFGSTTSNVTVSNYCNSPYPTNDLSGVIFTTVLGSLSLDKVYSAATGVGSNTNALPVQILNNQNVIKSENIEGYTTARNGNGNPNAIVYTSCVMADGVYIKNNTCIGGKFSATNMSRFEVDGIDHSDQCSGVSSSLAILEAIYPQNVQNCVIRNVTKCTDGAAPRSSILRTDANCKNIYFVNINYDSSSNAGPQALLGNNIYVVNSNFGTVRDTGTSALASSGLANAETADTVLFQNVQFTVPDSYTNENGLGLCSRIFYEYVSGHSSWWRSSATYAVNYLEYGPFFVLLDSGSTSAGTLHCVFPNKVSRDILDLSGTAYVDNGGSLRLPTNGDYGIIKSYQPLRTITGFSATAVDPEDTNTANLQYDFELQNYGGTFTGTWTSLTAANLQTKLAALTGYDSDKGLSIRIKVTATSTNATNRVINIRMFTTNDSTPNLPAALIDYTITGVHTDTTAAAFISGTEVEYDTGVSGTYVMHLPYDLDGTKETATIKLRCYDCVWDDYSLSYDQYPIIDASNQTSDTEVTESNKATTAAYTSLETCAKIYDYVKYWGTLRANLSVDQLCTKSGNDLDFGSYDLVIDKTAGSVLSKSSNTITIKADYVNTGSITTTGTITLSNGAVTGTAALTGSNGKSGNLSITDLTDASVYVDDNADAEVDYQSSVTGSYSLIIPFGSTGAWSAVVKQAGYRHAVFNFTASDGGSFSWTPAQPEKLNPDGTSMYQGTTSSLVSVSFNGTTQANIDIGNGSAGLQATFDETEDALLTNDGMAWLASGKSDCSQFNSAGGDYLFMSTGWRLRRASAGDVNATMNSFVVSADGIVVDGVNGGVQFLTSDSPTAIASAVWAFASRTLTGGAGNSIKVGPLNIGL